MCCKKNKAEFISGPFTNMMFEILKMQLIQKFKIFENFANI